MNAATLDYIREHANDDVRQLALRPVADDVDLRAALTQIEGRQLAARKLPTWAATDGLLFPPRLSLEQCSSEATALYKRRVVENLSLVNSPIADDCAASNGEERSTFIDLTAGLGIDFAAIASLFPHAIYVEQQESLCRLARHNLPLLGMQQAEVRCTTCEEVLHDLTSQRVSLVRHANSTSGTRPHDLLLMIDPARRNAAGNKVARIEDCTPDVCVLQEQLRAAAAVTLIKLSPMLDLTAALRSLKGVIEAHIVSVSGECKELLLLMRGDAIADNTPSFDECPIHCVDLNGNQLASSSSDFIFTRSSEAAAPLILANYIGTFLYEPNASILKAGAYKIICQRYPVQKLAADTHLYTSDRLIADFPGRCWQITDSATFAKKDLRRLLADNSAADLTVRGFPTSVATLRKQLHLREGGQAHLIATTFGSQRLLLRVERV